MPPSENALNHARRAFSDRHKASVDATASLLDTFAVTFPSVYEAHGMGMETRYIPVGPYLRRAFSELECTPETPAPATRAAPANQKLLRRILGHALNALMDMEDRHRQGLDPLPTGTTREQLSEAIQSLELLCFGDFLKDYESLRKDSQDFRKSQSRS